MLRVNRAHFPVTALGPGRRFGLWLQGCPLACPGCMSRDTWDAAGGTATSTEVLLATWQDAVDHGAVGMTISGGEPLAQAAGLREFLAAARRLDERLDILLYTGYELDELDPAQHAVVATVDAVVVGRYDVTRPTRLIWRGSANQRLLPMTELGIARYGAFVDHRPEKAPMQVRVDGERLWFIGVPPPGALARLEKNLRDDGIRLREVAWRP